MDVPETEDPDRFPRDGGSRRMSPRRRFQTEVTEKDDQGGLAQTNVPETEGQVGWARRLSFPSQGHSCVSSALALRFVDGCHRRIPLRQMTDRRRMSQTDVPETDDRDGWPRDRRSRRG